IPVNHPHAKTFRSLRHRLSDSSQAYDAEGGAMDIRTQKLQRSPSAPLPGPQIDIGFHYAARHRHNQGKSEISRSLSEYSGRITDGYAHFGGSLYIDVVVTDSIIGHYF